MVRTRLVDLKSVYPRYVRLIRSRWDELRMREEEEVREGCPKVRAIDVGLSGTLRVKNVLALGAIHCHSAIAWDVRQPRRKDVLALTVHSRAPAESADLEFFQHPLHPSVSEDVTRVDEAVQDLCGAFYHLLLLFGQRLAHRHLDIEDHIEGVLVIWHHRRQSRQVEIVLDVVFVHLAEELVASKRDKPRNPGTILV